MKPITTKLHGVLDYVTGATLIALPSALGVSGMSAGRALRGAGLGHVAYSLLTNYELGVKRVLPMRVHLALDAAGAVGLAASPWLLGTNRAEPRQWVPHVALGAYELTAVALSQPDTGRPRGGPLARARQRLGL